MPYMFSEDGLCVHKKNPDGSMGENMGCSDTREKAKEHMAALQAAMHGEGQSIDLVAFGSEVKDLGGGRIGGYLVRFTTEADPDLTGDYFDAKTEIHVPDSLDLLYNHGQDSTLKHKIIGKVSTKFDNVGLWAEAQVHLRDEYEKAVYEMAKAGKLGFSSGALSHLVDREPAGKAMHIKSWWIGEASLTPTPAEFRNGVVTLKSLTTPEAALPDKDVKALSIHKETKAMDEKEVKGLTPDEVKAQIDAALAARDAKIKAESDKAAELKAAEDAGYKMAVEDLKSHKAPRYHTTEKVDDDNDGMQAFKSWMRTGQENHGLIVPSAEFMKGDAADTKAAYNITTGASGGFLVPDPLFNQIIAKRDLASWVRQLPVQHFETTADHLLVPYENSTQGAMTLTAEAGAYTEAETTIGQRDLILYKYTNETRVNEEFLMYQSTNFDSWFANMLGRVVATTENTAFTTGTGTTQPTGVVTGATVANTTATTDIILPSELVAFMGYLGAGYNVMGECGFLMNNTTLWYLLGTTSAGHVLFPGSWSMSASGQKQLMGYPVVIDDDVVVYTTASAKCIVFGNFNYYGVVEKPGIVVQRNPYLYMATGQVGIFSSIFRGGGVLQGEAFYYLTNAS